MSTQLVLTCEHGGNRVPGAYAHLFRGARRALESHRGWDPGALALAKTFQRRLRAPLFSTNVTRLLVEPNRSLAHSDLFSEFTADLDGITKKVILDRYYHRHRNRIESWIAEQTDADKSVVHLSLHTFTPQLKGQRRNADLGLLYDPRRPREKSFCDDWHTVLNQLRPDLRIRRNYPYLGKSDGFTTQLRKSFAADQYAGIELEVNQLWFAKNAALWRRLKQDLAESFEAVVAR